MSTKNRKENKKKTKNIKAKKLKTILSALLIVGFAILGAVVAFVLKIIVTSPDLTPLSISPKEYTTFIYDENGKEVDKLHGRENRVYVPLDQIPENLRNAVIVMEDVRFYEHNGIDYKALARAAVIDVLTLSFKEGASTITQQLVKNNILTSDKKISRKIREMYLATVLEKKLKEQYGKDKAKDYILELYLNTIHLGNGCNGVQSAANRYFGKDVSELTLDECTILGAIIKSPSNLEPTRNSENNNNRRQIILKYMVDKKMITEEEYDASLASNPYENVSNFNAKYAETNMTNSYFVDSLIDEVARDIMTQYGYTREIAERLIYSGGLNIYSTMDKNVQNAIDNTFSNTSNSFATTGTEYRIVYNLDLKRKDEDGKNTEKYYQKLLTVKTKDDATVNAAMAEAKADLMQEGDEVLKESHYIQIQPQAAMVIIDYHNGHVKGIAGGRGEKETDRDLNRAIQSKRQSGSTFKVLAAFAPAIDMKIHTAGSVQDDVPYYLSSAYANKEIKNWYSKPYPYRGLSTLREGTRDSMNIVAVKTVMDVGLDNAFNYLTKFGFTSLVDSRTVNGKVYTDKSPSVALGGLTDGVSVLELTSAYGAIANGGILNKPIFYTKVTTLNGDVLLTNTTTSTKVIDESTAFIVTDMMRDVITSGTGGTAGISGQPVAGKTGTTSDSKDLTFAGYTPYYVGGIWFGHDIPKPMYGDQSIHTKAWRSVMQEVHKGLPWKDFKKPTSVVSASICRESGLLAAPGLCENDPRGSAVYTEYFAEGTVPTETCTCHVKKNVVLVDGKYYLAKEGVTPANLPVMQAVFIERSDDLGSYYDVNIKDSIQDAQYEAPKEYYNPHGFEINGDESEDDFDDYFNDPSTNPLLPGINSGNTDDDYEDYTNNNDEDEDDTEESEDEDDINITDDIDIQDITIE